MCKPMLPLKAGDEETGTAAMKDVSYDKSFAPSLNFLELSDLFDLSKPWVLVENGSYQGYFDNVPAAFRVGPWKLACRLYLVVAVAWVLFECIQCYLHPPTVPETDYHSTYGTNTWQWWYNATGFAWTLYIAYKSLKTPMGWSAGLSYTLQSWTLITLRHGLSALAPFVPELAVINEHLRFPMLLQTAITFLVWNFILFPAIAITMKNPNRKRDFYKFNFGFLLSQLHMANLPLAFINGVWGTPARELNQMDFCMALAMMLQYLALYLFVLDRLGVHFYFVFSPRTPLALFSWTAFIGFQFAGFAMWKLAILKYGGVVA
ncbi:expressed unknown protein [Seminavis robusta]|uniref:Uncharacterized protein n=1 Tax=Seminavis robusta TaxID=568900 RepID=A0A9N8DHP8_9STRA|nr:expressed unknown protein [Seminavis robusta]|eukprot:Sro149_g068380.1 n/a (319) ;mRNA; r:30165-31121